MYVFWTKHHLCQGNFVILRTPGYLILLKAYRRERVNEHVTLSLMWILWNVMFWRDRYQVLKLKSRCRVHTLFSSCCRLIFMHANRIVRNMDIRVFRYILYVQWHDLPLGIFIIASKRVIAGTSAVYHVYIESKLSLSFMQSNLTCLDYVLICYSFFFFFLFFALTCGLMYSFVCLFVCTVLFLPNYYFFLEPMSSFE